MSTLSPFIGIDFGTSNSKMAWYNPKTNQAEIIRNSDGEPETPSVVYYGGNEILVGSHALEMLDYEKERERVILSIKRELVTTPLLAIAEKSIKPVEIATEILRKLKRDAEECHFHQQIARVVVTYPASFGPLERDKIREATDLAGFAEVEMLEEPTAAAMAYAQMGLKVGKSVLVYDLGGGTFDLAVLNAEEDGVFRLALDPQGTKRCGGDDFDEALYIHCDAKAREKLGRSISLTGKRDLQFLQQCRQRKENLSTSERRFFKSYLEPGPVLFQYELDRSTLEALIRPIVEETVRKTKVLLEQANAEGQAVDTLVLIGGSSRMPLVKRLLERSLPLKPLQWQYQDIAVALGAAYHAHSKWGELRSDQVIVQSNKSDLRKHLLDEQYLKAVVEVWSNEKLEKPKIERLTALAKEIGLSKEQAAQVEQGVMGDTKETVFEKQQIEQYLKAVKSVWSGKKLDQEKLERLTALAKEFKLNTEQVAQIEREVMGQLKEGLFTPPIVTKTEPVKSPLVPRVIVSPTPGEGQYTMISEALRQGPPDVPIQVRPGVYRESLVLDRQVELVGDGPTGAIIIEATGAPCLVMATERAMVRGMTLRRKGGPQQQDYMGGSTVFVPQGQSVLENCDLWSESGNCLLIVGSKTNPTIRHCRLHDGKQNGIWIYENGRGVIEDCDIFGNALAGVAIRQGGNPTIRRCKLHDGKQDGLDVWENGRGVIEDCDIFGNARTGVEIGEGGNPTIRRCKLHNGKQDGLWVYENGQGVIEDCDIFGNTLSGAAISQGGNPTIRRSQIHDGKAGGLYVWRNGQGVLEDCDIFGNALAGVEIRQGGNPTIRRSQIHDGKQEGIHIHDKGRGTIEGCTVVRNAKRDWSIDASSQVRRL